MIYLRFVGSWSPFATLLVAMLLSGLAFWLYRRQLRGLELGWNQWVLPGLRASAILLITLTLAEPIVESRWRDGEPSRIQFLIDASRSMSVSKRFERATQLLSGPQGILARLQNRFDTSVGRFSESGIVELWNSSSGHSPSDDSLAYDWGPAAWGESSPIGDTLASLVTSQTGPQSSDHSQTQSDLSVVLLSDGQNNSGRDPKGAAHQLHEPGITLFTIGLAPFEETLDLAVRQFTLPERIHRSDALSGTVSVSQTLAEGTRFTLQIEHAGAIAWSESFIATDEPQRTIEFTIPMAPLFEHALTRLPERTEVSRLPMKLTARLLVGDGEANEFNNARDGHLLVTSQKPRVLLIDGRSRWEARYLKNMFSRDPTWLLDSVLLTGAGDADAATQKFPDGKAALLEYDLIVLGEVAPSVLAPEWIEWLREFVEQAGGGLIVVDGAREHLRSPYYHELHRLLPVKWLASQVDREPSRRAALDKLPRVTAAGQALDALRLSSVGSDESLQIWNSLLPLQFVSEVEPLPGAEVLVEAVSDVEHLPLLVTQRYGAGRVLFATSDETWHWRYQRDESLHSRLWLQLASWTMRVPMSLRAEFLSLDSGAASYLPTQSIAVRCELRQADGTPAAGREATVQVYSSERAMTSTKLTQQSIEGTYAAQIAPLPPGDYSVRVAAPNFSTRALDLQSQFSVVEPPKEEMQRLSCNAGELRIWAEQTGGQYLPEEQADELVELLEPLVRAKMQTSAMLLWQSYWWFAAAILLLIAEWFLRKRIGLA